MPTYHVGSLDDWLGSCSSSANGSGHGANHFCHTQGRHRASGLSVAARTGAACDDYCNPVSISTFHTNNRELEVCSAPAVIVTDGRSSKASPVPFFEQRFSDSPGDDPLSSTSSACAVGPPVFSCKRQSLLSMQLKSKLHSLNPPVDDDSHTDHPKPSVIDTSSNSSGCFSHPGPQATTGSLPANHQPPAQSSSASISSPTVGTATSTASGSSSPSPLPHPSSPPLSPEDSYGTCSYPGASSADTSTTTTAATASLYGGWSTGSCSAEGLSSGSSSSALIRRFHKRVSFSATPAAGASFAGPDCGFTAASVPGAADNSPPVSAFATKQQQQQSPKEESSSAGCPVGHDSAVAAAESVQAAAAQGGRSGALGAMVMQCASLPCIGTRQADLASLAKALSTPPRATVSSLALCSTSSDSDAAASGNSLYAATCLSSPSLCSAGSSSYAMATGSLTLLPGVLTIPEDAEGTEEGVTERGVATPSAVLGAEKAVREAEASGTAVLDVAEAWQQAPRLEPPVSAASASAASALPELQLQQPQQQPEMQPQIQQLQPVWALDRHCEVEGRESRRRGPRGVSFASLFTTYTVSTTTDLLNRHNTSQQSHSSSSAAAATAATAAAAPEGWSSLLDTGVSAGVSHCGGGGGSGLQRSKSSGLNLWHRHSAGGSIQGNGEYGTRYADANASLYGSCSGTSGGGSEHADDGPADGVLPAGLSRGLYEGTVRRGCPRKAAALARSASLPLSGARVQLTS